jgi:hypothetical protein
MISRKYFIPGLIIVIILLCFYPEIITSCMQKAPTIGVKFEVDASTSVTNNVMLSKSNSVKETARVFADVQISLLKACTETVNDSGLTGKAKINGILDCVDSLSKNMPK